METVEPNRVGLVLGAVGGGWHFLWVLLVAGGFAQFLINFVFWMHFLAPPYVVTPFHPGIALVLIIVTSAIGYAMGYVLGAMWNWIHR